MASANLTMGIKGLDKTGAAFKSIAWRAKSTGLQIKSMLGGALAAAGAYLSFRAIKGGVDELGHLSDIAQKCGTSVDDLTRASLALSTLGIQNVGIDQLGKSFDSMQRATGRTGMAGFYQTIEELAKIPDTAKRSQEAVRIFGSSGMELMPLINAAKDGTAALQGVCDAMPGVSQAAADAGDAAADAMAMAAAGMKSTWLNGIGAVCNWLADILGVEAREVGAAIAAYFDYYARRAAQCFISHFQKVQNFLSAIIEPFRIAMGVALNGGSFSDVAYAFHDQWDWEMKALEDSNDEIDRLGDERIARWDAILEREKESFSHLQENIDKAAKKADGDKGAKAIEAAAEAASKAPAIRNELMLAGSNASLRASIIGPQLQSETKKQTALLEKIATNTQKTADEVADSGSDLEVI